MTNDIDDLLDQAETDTREWAPVSGAEFHALLPTTIASGSGPVGFSSVVLSRGQVVTITDALLEANRDRNGNSLIDLIDDPDGQIMKWGEQRFAPGRPSPSMRPYTAGSVEEADAREAAEKRAWALTDAQERAEARAAVERGFGRLTSTSTTIAEYSDDGKIVRRGR